MQRITDIERFNPGSGAVVPATAEPRVPDGVAHDDGSGTASSSRATSGVPQELQQRRPPPRSCAMAPRDIGKLLKLTSDAVNKANEFLKSAGASICKSAG